MWEVLDGIREVLARPWVGVCLPFALSLSYVYDVFIILHCNSFLSYFFFFSVCNTASMQISDHLLEFCVEIKFIEGEGLISFPDLLV